MKAALILALFLVVAVSLVSFASENAPPLPSGNSKWLDGKAFQWKDLQGKVVLLNVWTFECWNSYRSLPWLVSLPRKFPGLQLIGIHSPEFESEKNRTRMRQAMANYGVAFPQVLDDEHAYWNALGNRYWPAFYVVDRQGRIRGKYFGETHEGDSQAIEIEKLLARLEKE